METSHFTRDGGKEYTLSVKKILAGKKVTASLRHVQREEMKRLTTLGEEPFRKGV